MEVVTEWHPDGGLGHYTEDLAKAGWSDSKLAQKIPFEEFWKSQLEVLDYSENYIITVHGSEGVPVGGVVLIPAYDAQVGKAMTVWHQYLKPEHRGSSRLWREVLRASETCTRHAGLRFIVWSHRNEETGRFYSTYKEVQYG